MTEILLSLLVGVCGAFFLILKQNSELKKKEKLHDIELKDVKLKTKQEQITQDSEKLKRQLEELDKPIEAIPLSDSEIENFWNRNKK
jgi:septal ring factor EnvC (AmiA/AmiB activator)